MRLTLVAWLVQLLLSLRRTRSHVRFRKKLLIFSQLTNIDYEPPTVNRSAYGFTKFLRDENIHEADSDGPLIFSSGKKIMKIFGNSGRGQCSTENFFCN
jgi:hypothetical protein